MHKKLLLSFVSVAVILIHLAQPTIASGLRFPSPSNSYSITDSSSFVYNQGNLSKVKRPGSVFKLLRIDLPIMQNEDPEGLSEASTDENIIYSPDLPEPLSKEKLCEDPNYYLALELEMINMVNKARVEAGENELIYSEELSYFARIHSKDMADNHYFSHKSPSSGSYVKRLYASGINYISSGENLARFTCLESAHAALLASFGHKQNMLSSKYTHVGVGIEWDEKLEVYCITQWFARFY